MATKKAAKRKVKKVAKKASKKAAKKRAVSPRSKPVARTSAKTSGPGSADRRGVITHTELASADPAATRAWCESVLGWKFGDSVPTPAGPYHMWRFANGTGGGIRSNNPPEMPGTTPYCEVADIKKAFARAIAAGATEMLAPEAIPGDMGWIAIVAAPGGVPIGFWALR